VQESLLAVPYALGKLGAYQRSLERYEEAIGIYVREMNRLDTSIAAIRAGKLTALFLQEDPIEEMGWFWKLERLPDAPESHYLEHCCPGMTSRRRSRIIAICASAGAPRSVVVGCRYLS